MSDVEGLLEITNKVSEYYFQEYKFNITNILTLPSLTLGIFVLNSSITKNIALKWLKGHWKNTLENLISGKCWSLR